MKCKDCKYKKNIANTEETGAALCTNSESFFAVDIMDDCHFIPKKRGLLCEDCERLGNDHLCMTQSAEDSAYSNDGTRCGGYIDKRQEVFKEMLMFWKVQGLLTREQLIEIIDKFEAYYKDLTEQSSLTR